MRIAELILRRGRGPFALSLLLSLPIVLLFTILLFCLYIWEDGKRLRNFEMQLRESARAHVEQVALTGLWNAQHGGVYVMLAEVGSGSNMKVSPEDAVNIGGKLYTKLNPVYISRQLTELAADKGSFIRFRISSLNPVNPSNRAGKWEARMLRAFEKGETEGYGIIEQEGLEYFRYMSRLVATEGCLGCHSEQGLRPGDIIGGVSVIIPAGLNRALQSDMRRRSIVVFGVIWGAAALLILGITWVFSRRLSRAVKSELEGEKLKTAVGMAGAAAHELRQPLSIIMGFSELLREKAANGENTDREAEIIISQCHRMNEIISRMLNVTSYRTKSYGGHTEIFDFGLEPEESSRK